MSSCGGGGGLNANPGQSKTFHVDAGQAHNEQFGNDIQVKIPAPAFPTGADGTLVRYDRPNYQIANPDVQRLSDQLEVETSVLPQANLTVGFTITSLPSNRPILAAYLLGNQWRVLPSSVQNSIVTVTLPANQSGQTDRGSAFHMLLELGLLPGVTLPDPQTGMVRMTGGGSLGSGSIVLLHGINSNIDIFDSIAPLLVKAGFQNVYAFAYDWLCKVEDSGNRLADALEALGGKNKDITILGHSMGCLVGRYALEVRGASKRIDTAYWVNGPNMGSFATTPGELLMLVYQGYINSSLGGSPVAGLESPSLAELLPNSSFIQELNRPHGQRGVVNYRFISSNSHSSFAHGDGVVDRDSALCNGINVEELTGGTIDRRDLWFDNFFYVHSTAFDTVEGRNQLLALLNVDSSSTIVLTAEPNPADFNELFDLWQWAMLVANVGNSDQTVDEIMFDTYDRYGQWTMTQWYDPTTPAGEEFPQHLVWLNQFLAAHETWPSIGIAAFRTEEARFKALTVVMSVRCHDTNNRQSLKEYPVILHDGDIWPNPYDGRSRGRGPANTSCRLKFSGSR